MNPRIESRRETQAIAEAASGSSIARLDSGRLLLFAAAFLSFLASVYLFFTGSREEGIFVGLWVPSILSAGTLLARGRSNG